MIRFEWAGAGSHWVRGSEAHFPAPTTQRVQQVVRLSSEVKGRPGKGFPLNLAPSEETLGLGPSSC
jgi:hypothetical protein